MPILTSHRAVLLAAAVMALLLVGGCAGQDCLLRGRQTQGAAD
jgi:hypothetical protein